MGAAKPSSSCSDSSSAAGLDTGSGSGSKLVKSCADCNTTKTPLWRSGPAGPKSLCNACGIKYNKKRRLGVAKKEKREKEREKEKKIAAAAVESGGDAVESGGLEESLKRKLVSLGGEIILRGKRSGMVLSTLREEEQAAMLLMAMSCAE